MSPFYKPAPGVLYAYGNFCGPGLPKFATPAGQDIEGRIQTIKSIPPIDDIDEVCRAHDFCYELFGHDRVDCDDLAFHLMPLFGVHRCDDVAIEVAVAVGHLKQTKNAEEAEADGRMLRTAEGVFHTIMSKASAGFEGWPNPGECRIPMKDSFLKYIDGTDVPVSWMKSFNKHELRAKAMVDFHNAFAGTTCVSGICTYSPELRRGSRAFKSRYEYARRSFTIDDMLGKTALTLSHIRALDDVR